MGLAGQVRLFGNAIWCFLAERCHSIPNSGHPSKYKPSTIIVWGKNDKIFPADGATQYLRALPRAEMHILDTGHFVLGDKFDVANR